MIIGEIFNALDNQDQQEEGMTKIDEEENQICIEEHKVGGYECPEFILLAMEEKCIEKP